MIISLIIVLMLHVYVQKCFATCNIFPYLLPFSRPHNTRRHLHIAQKMCNRCLRETLQPGTGTLITNQLYYN